MLRRAFVIITPAPDSSVKESVKANFEDSFEYSPNIFFIRTPEVLLAKDVAERVGFDRPKDDARSGVVHKLNTGYWGRASPLLWEWLADSAE